MLQSGISACLRGRSRLGPGFFLLAFLRKFAQRQAFIVRKNQSRRNHRDKSDQPKQDSTTGCQLRRRFVNNTGANVTRLRFRIVDFSSLPASGAIADLRALNSTTITVSGITDSATCAATGTPSTAPCTVTVFGTTLEEPPNQPLGGALNSTMSAGTITLPTPLAPGQSINFNFRLGVQNTGAFKFFFNVEALP